MSALAGGGAERNEFTIHVCSVPSSPVAEARGGKVGRVVACLSEVGGIRVVVSHVADGKFNPPEEGGFDLARTYMPALTTQELGRTLLYTPCVDSTQSVLDHLSQPTSAVINTACVADRQTGGKGRGSNVWVSPPGCLLFSFNFAATDGTRLPFAQYLMSLALIKAVQSLEGCENLPIKIKWPNDIYARVGPDFGDIGTIPAAQGEKVGYTRFIAPPRHGDYVKIGGVLCQSSYDYQSKSFVVVAGIGLNILNEQPTTCLEQLRKSMIGSGNDKIGASVSCAAVLAAFFNTVEPMLNQFRSDGFDPFLDEYLAHWLHTGQSVTAVDLARGEQDQSNMPEDGTKLEIIGIAASSGLLAVDRATGQQYELLPDGNSLDFFQGLLKRKL
eukprot:g1046.t1